MDNNVISLRQFIDNKENYTFKVQTFCRLMKTVYDTIEKEQRPLVRINLDEIKINPTTGQIILPDNLFAENDKTIAGVNTGISLIADRKSSFEHKRISFALMVLGWYVNEDHSAIFNDLVVLENFNYYMSKVPNWLQEYFISIFLRMDYTKSFSEYYKDNFIYKVKTEVQTSLEPYHLNNKQMKKATSVIVKKTERIMKGGE